MGSIDASFKLPTLDFSSPDLKPGTPSWESLRCGVLEAIKEYGCFEATLDKVPTEVRRNVFESLDELFHLPMETKMKNTSEIPMYGYVGEAPHIPLPLYESVGIGSPHVHEKVDEFAKILWPQGHPKFSKSIQFYAEQVVGLDETVRKMVLESFGLDKLIDEHLNSTEYLLRVMKYRAPKTADEQDAMLPHTDKGFMTILHPNDVSGLSIQNKEGEWIEFNRSPNTYLVMMADCFYAWLNGRIRAAIHRVKLSGDEARFSMGLFTVPKPGVTIHAAEGMVDEEHPQLFKPFKLAEFLVFYDTKAGQQSPTPLKDYCGTGV
ncbi:Probable 2-oxoglutarate-dependent dioxygenase AOP1 [Linum grandiflorum]